MNDSLTPAHGVIDSKTGEIRAQRCAVTPEGYAEDPDERWFVLATWDEGDVEFADGKSKRALIATVDGRTVHAASQRELLHVALAAAGLGLISSTGTIPDLLAGLQ